MNDILAELKKIIKEDSIYSKPAKYLLDYDGDINNLTVSKIATDTYSSTATIVRLSQKIGVSGFSELKVLLKRELMYEMQSSSVLNNYKEHINNTIDQTFKTVKYEDLIIASNIMYNAKSINLFGVGGSKLVLQDFYSKLLRLNFNTSNEVDLHFQHVVSKNLGENDVALVVTYSGQTKDVLKIVDNLNNSKCKTIIISANDELIDKCDILLKLSKTENFSRIYSLSSKLSIEVILDFLFIEILKNNSKKFELIMKNNRIEK